MHVKIESSEKLNVTLKKMAKYKRSNLNLHVEYYKQIFVCQIRINVLFLEKYELRLVGFDSLGITCPSRDPMFALSNSAEVGGFFQDVKILSTKSPGRTLSRWTRI